MTQLLVLEHGLARSRARAAQDHHHLGLWDDGQDELDIITNEVVDLANAGRFDEAELKCAELKQRGPDMIDWRDRYAVLYETRGDFALAAEHYRLAAEYAATNDGFDQDGIDLFRSKADEIEQRARALVTR